MKISTSLFKYAAPIVLLVGIGGCTWGQGYSNPEPTEMHRNFSQTVDIQTGVVIGDLERAVSAAGRLASMATEGRGPYWEAMGAEANKISRATDLDTVARSAATMAGACGSCHKENGGGPTFVVGSPAPDGSSQAATMIRHLWAADRLWEGLVGPSQESWLAGSEALGRGWQAYGDAIQASSSPESARSYVTAVQELAGVALQATTQEERAAVYGNILGTCRRCHSTIGVMAER